jgi:hypothetical protein
VKQLIGLNQDLTRSVVILEDIVDGPLWFKSSLKRKTFKIATLFFKPEAYKRTSRLIMLESEFQINL